MLTDPSPSRSGVALDLRSAELFRAKMRLAPGCANSTAGSSSHLVTPRAPRFYKFVSLTAAGAEKPI